jgi:hypothetical protein
LQPHRFESIIADMRILTAILIALACPALAAQPECSVGIPYIETSKSGAYEAGCVLPGGKKEMHVLSLGDPLSYKPDDAQIVIGMCAGWHVTTGKRNILIGDYTATPTPGTNDFINIANKLCFWRTTGERVACPPPEHECQ